MWSPGPQQTLELAGDDSRTTVDQLVVQSQPRPEQTQPFYLLDLDAYAERNVRYSVEGIETTLREFNDDIRSLLRLGSA